MQVRTGSAADCRRVVGKSALITALIGIPFVVLLMYCAWLPMMMGMYFFILGGLLLGGIWFRMARRVRPAPVRAVYGACLAVMLFWVVVYLGAESQVKPWHLARDMAEASTLRIGVSSPQEKQQRYDEAVAHVQGVLREYGPGPVGYLVWNAMDGQMPPMARYGGRTMMLDQRRAYWIVRIVLSIVLLGFGLRLQVKELAKPEEADRKGDAAPSEAATGAK